MSLTAAHRFIIALTLCVFCISSLRADYEVRVIPDHPDWLYEIGEPVTFRIEVLSDGTPIENINVSYEIGPEKFPNQKGKATVPAGGLTLDGGTMDVPGFLRCTAKAYIDNKTYTGMATVGYSPDQIVPTQTEPDDFDQFWAEGLAELAKIPLDPRMEFLPKASDDKVKVYHVSFRTFGRNDSQYQSRIYGILCVPAEPGSYPAVLQVPGAGAHPCFGDKRLAAEGVITLQIGIHGIPVNLPAEVYDQMRSGALQGYMTSNLDHAPSYYYRRVYLACIRANDFLTSLPEYDGETLIVRGGSQGGALAIVTAALDPRVKALACSYPALSDLTGYLEGRAGGWPHMFDGKPSRHSTPEKIATARYYDVVNFAKRIKVPGFYTWGYNDVTCPPTSMFAAYNVITAPKELFIAKEAGHTPVASQNQAIYQWLKTHTTTDKVGN